MLLQELFRYSSVFRWKCGVSRRTQNLLIVAKYREKVKGVKDNSEDRENDMNVKKTMLYRQIGAKIAYYRTLRQMTQTDLAKKVNLSRSSLGRIERGKYNRGVPISTLLDIAEGLHIELSSLVTFSEEEKKVWWDIDKNML